MLMRAPTLAEIQQAKHNLQTALDYGIPSEALVHSAKDVHVLIAAITYGPAKDAEGMFL